MIVLLVDLAALHVAPAESERTTISHEQHDDDAHKGCANSTDG